MSDGTFSIGESGLGWEYDGRGAAAIFIGDGVTGFSETHLTYQYDSSFFTTRLYLKFLLESLQFYEFKIDQFYKFKLDEFKSTRILNVAPHLD